jgi:hypothetical protein
MKRPLKKLTPVGATLSPDQLRLVAGGHKEAIPTYDKVAQQCRVDGYVEVPDGPKVPKDSMVT